jgi:chromosome segregation ATPase
MGFFGFGGAKTSKIVDGTHVTKYSEQVAEWQTSLARLKQRRDAEEKEADRLRQLSAKLKAQQAQANTNLNTTMASLGSLKRNVNKFESTFLGSPSQDNKKT